MAVTRQKFGKWNRVFGAAEEVLQELSDAGIGPTNIVNVEDVTADGILFVVFNKGL